MKSVAPFIAIGGGIVVAVVVGIFLFGSQLSVKKVPEASNAPVFAKTETASAAKEKAAPKASASKADEPVQEAGIEAAKPDVPVAQKADGSKDSASGEEVKVADDVAKPETEAAAEQPVATAEAAAPVHVAPSFDVVRVQPDGQTLVAGKAEPGWRVELRDGDKVLSSAVADANGDWVMVLEEVLKQGVSDLSLAAQAEDGSDASVSRSNVTVALPEDGKGELLVIETEPGQASKVLAKIAPAVEKANAEEVFPGHRACHLRRDSFQGCCCC